MEGAAEISEFSSEVTEEYLERAGPLPPEALPTAESGSRSVSVRMDRAVLRRLQALAWTKENGVQALLRGFLTERLHPVGQTGTARVGLRRKRRWTAGAAYAPSRRQRGQCR